MRKSPVLCFLFLILSVLFFNCTEGGYLVSYESDYDVLPEDFSTPKNTILTEKELPELTASGFIFEGWFDGSQKAIPDEYEVISDVTLTAKWTAVSNNNDSDNNDSDDDNKKGSDDSTDNPENKPELVDPELSDSLVKYTVEHYLQNINDDNYSLVASDTQNLTGKPGEKTSAKANTYTGFVVKPITQETISQYGTTVAKVYYDRLSYTITFDTDGGSNIPPITARYGADISKLPVPVKDGFVFSKWQELSGTLGTKLEDDIKCIAIWKEEGSASTDDDGDDDGPNGIKRVGPVLNAEVHMIEPEHIEVKWKNPDDDNLARVEINLFYYTDDLRFLPESVVYVEPPYDNKRFITLYDGEEIKNLERQFDYYSQGHYYNFIKIIPYDKDENKGYETNLFITEAGFHSGEPEDNQYAGKVISDNIKISGKEYERTGEVIVLPKGTKAYINGGTNMFSKNVILLPFIMGQYEVTCDLYNAVTGAYPTSDKREGNELLNPVSKVTWLDAVKFCNKLSEKLGLECVYSYNGETNPEKWVDPTNNGFIIDITKNGYRLPTYNEWYYAYNSGYLENYEKPKDSAGDVKIESISGLNWITGEAKKTNSKDLWKEYCWLGGNSGGKTHPVGEKIPNNLKIYDMTGNVREFLNDGLSGYNFESMVFSYTNKETFLINNKEVFYYENFVNGIPDGSNDYLLQYFGEKRYYAKSDAGSDTKIWFYTGEFNSLNENESWCTGFRLARTIK